MKNQNLNTAASLQVVEGGLVSHKIDDASQDAFSLKIEENRNIIRSLRESTIEGRLKKKPSTNLSLNELGEVPLDNRESFREVFKFRIRTARKNLGLTQSQMAQKMGVILVTYSKWENGASGIIPHEKIHNFCDITGLQISELFHPFASHTERRLISAGF